ncbi:TRAP-type mannitol/chloroaromatic compound transport system permease small subunit [Lewinella aquimaris]|uniref:TRAP-type mannitol/chloroaromatic compound transport system permease small subunit n=1 Tax=Neolewinella aquimaris TaxID=1835722 RepID=A0A840E305_9BACT|nr:TRAP transporter small permease subunit [Neolewinella aquimaris]MBB4078112.1 TRAP-type mannitol/chloroaromatic compound transport system permease small subunit [Neolewinella aquimaris]
MNRLIRQIERTVSWIGRAAGLLNLALIVVVVTDVLLRWFFSLTSAWVIELEWHLFALIFLLGIPYALQQDRHVRVDLFYESFRPRDKALVNVVGTLIFLLPWAAVLLYTSWHYAAEAWISGEGSPNPNGIPYFFPIKAVVPFAAALLILQGIATGWHAVRNSQEI